MQPPVLLMKRVCAKQEWLFGMLIAMSDFKMNLLNGSRLGSWFENGLTSWQRLFEIKE